MITYENLLGLESQFINSNKVMGIPPMGLGTLGERYDNLVLRDAMAGYIIKTPTVIKTSTDIEPTLQRLKTYAEILSRSAPKKVGKVEKLEDNGYEEMFS